MNNFVHDGQDGDKRDEVTGQVTTDTDADNGN